MENVCIKPEAGIYPVEHDYKNKGRSNATACIFNDAEDRIYTMKFHPYGSWANPVRICSNWFFNLNIISFPR